MRSLAAAFAALLVAACATAASTPISNEPRMARLDYVELPATEIPATRRFYEQAFGWAMTEFAPT